MALWIQISPGSHEPIYLQIAERISEAVAKREISPGDRLPPVRKLAAELVINPNTVARAYARLEQAGLVTTKTRAGTFVSDPKLRRPAPADLTMLTKKFDSLITQALNFGLHHPDLLTFFKDRLDQFTNKTKPGKNRK
jgi:GntR family transcriptional regulator